METLNGASTNKKSVEFKIGDTVRLKSGGEIMTVKEKCSFFDRCDSARYICVWLDKQGKYYEKMFSSKMIVNETDINV